ncbi:TlpA family protein disulfide reductase [Paragemmobacter straminiformis]|uniref:TlpA family protein disulfide reductase n=1 Tax=Paragemmobacter straminiformis TaxID=2045119 RepID=A0A842I5G2_9RHOB|nr:TlpA disulfide reductase family protein [Gemmobacter straminiformis]MBC2834899.1 TlpA family protein disulfide reductase [Gemmobacter straminiformis]
MRQIWLAVLYTALMLGANPAAADVAALREGDMKKLALHETPVDLPEAVFLDEADTPHPLADWRGKWVVLNFWATWCAPCRKEMPSLDRLQAAMPGLAVVPVATGRNAVEGIQRFYEEAGVTGLPILRDPKSDLARAMGVLALPVTVILNPQGQEVARLIGDAEWDSDNAKAVLAAMMSEAAGG